jgi:RNA polymerase sigma factor (sigma-70 family)
MRKRSAPSAMPCALVRSASWVHLPVTLDENDFSYALVCIRVMLADASGRSILSWEGALASRDDASVEERVRRLADAELDRAYRLAGLILGDQQEAQDATQDALLRAWRAAASLRDPAGFQAWFDRILVNVCRDRLRRRGTVRLVVVEDAPLVDATRDPFRTILDRDEVTRAMASLDADHRIVLVLHYWADLKLDDVATRIGRPVGTVKSRLHRGLATMRKELDEHHSTARKTLDG